MNRGSLLLASLALAVSGVTAARAQVPRPGEDGVSYMPDEAPMMQKAVARALNELDGFLKLAAAPSAHQSSFALKVGLPVGDGQKEYVWVVDFRKLRDGRFTGIINNEVGLTDDFKLGDTFTFARSQIIDWTYIDSAEEKMHGNYTLCALLSQEPGVDADRLKQAYKLDCEL